LNKTIQKIWRSFSWKILWYVCGSGRNRTADTRIFSSLCSTQLFN